MRENSVSIQNLIGKAYKNIKLLYSPLLIELLASIKSINLSIKNFISLSSLLLILLESCDICLTTKYCMQRGVQLLKHVWVTDRTMFVFLLVCNTSEWSPCYVSEGDCLRNRTVCSDVQVANCIFQWSNWSDWSSCSYNSTGACVQTRKKITECGEEMIDTVKYQPQLCNSE